MKFESLEDIQYLQESVDLECKLAAGKDGKGQIPEDFWKSYSAMANTKGGIIILGMKEKRGNFTVVGVNNVQRVRDQFFENANNKTKVNYNLLDDTHIEEKCFNGNTVLILQVPPANKSQKPIYLKGNQANTYKRNASGDYLCSSSEVEAMIRDKSPESIDGLIIEDFGLSDFNSETVRSYRQIFTNLQPDNPLVGLTDPEFLVRIGALKQDRKVKKIFSTRAGLLMFGEYRHIKEVFPNFFLDYRENYDPISSTRFTHRIVPDDSWSGNIFDFYYKVIRRLTDNISIPFKLNGIHREENTPVRTALREALTNTLIHADYFESASILLLKNENEFIFENPGHTIQPLPQLLQSVQELEKIDSECRNKTLQDMFRRIQVGEALGSGLHTIYKNWEAQQWQIPDFSESSRPAKTIFKLKTIELFHAKAIESLSKDISSFSELSDTEKRILVLCDVENNINHDFIMEKISNIHPKDLTGILSSLTERGLLVKHGKRRGMSYTLSKVSYKDLSLFSEVGSDENSITSDENSITSDENSITSDENSITSGDNSITSGDNSITSGDNSITSGDNSITSDENSITSDDNSITSDDNSITSGDNSITINIRMTKEQLSEAVLVLCKEKPHTSSDLEKKFNKGANYLRTKILKPLIKSGALSFLYPETPNSPKQAYIANDKEPD